MLTRNPFGIILAAFATMVLAACLLARPAHADSTHETNSGDVACTVNGAPTAVSDVCAVVVAANPKSYCASFADSEAEARATAICGDAVSFCNGGSAFSLAVVKASCEQSQANSNAASASCDEAVQSVTLNVPKCPDVTVGTHVLRCEVWKQRRDGRFIGKRCATLTEAAAQ